MAVNNTPTPELKPCIIGENPVLTTDFTLSYATGFNNTGRMDWSQIRIGVSESAFSMYSKLKDIFGIGETLIEVSRKTFMPTRCWTLESTRYRIKIFEASQPFQP